MDPATIAVGVMVQVITAGLARVADEAALDGYQYIKRLMLERYDERSERRVSAGITALEADPTSTRTQENLTAALQSAGAGHDEDLRAAADRVMQFFADPLPALDTLEQTYHEAGSQALGQIMDNHVSTVLDVRAQYVMSDTDLLSTGITACDQVPMAVRNDIAAMHQYLRSLVQSVAAKIEDEKYRSAEEAVARMPLSAADKIRAQNLIAADKAVRLSYQTLRVTVEYFGELNNRVLRSINQTLDPEEEANLVLGNAVLIYEMSEFVIRFVEGFAVEGQDAIAAVHSETLAQIESTKRRQEELRTKLTNPSVDPDIRASMQEDIDNREGALTELSNEWDRYLNDVGSLGSAVGDIQSKLPTLELIKENSRLQIEVLQLVAMMRFLQKNTEAISGTISALKEFRLAPLSPSRVRRLLGVS